MLTLPISGKTYKLNKMKQQAIKTTSTGTAYVTHQGSRLPLNSFIRTEGDTITHKGKSLQVHGWHSVGYWGAYGIHISECGEYAIVFYKQNF